MSRSNIIDAGWLIDGTGVPVREKVRLCIENGRIVSLDSNPEVRNGPEAADLTSYTVLPCLVDSHVHLCMSGTCDPASREKQLDAGFDEAADLISEHLRRHLSCGVLAVRDGGDRYGHLLRYINESLNTVKMPVRVRCAGRAWHRAARYGGLIGRAVMDNAPLSGAVIEDSEKKDQIKIVNSGLNSLKEFGRETLPQFGAEDLSDTVKFAGKAGLKVMVHANGKKPVAAAIYAGCSSIEHGFFMGLENLKAMAEKKTVWVPTACTMKAYSEVMKPGSREYEVSRMNLDHQLEQISKARELGVTIALGTDAGSIGVHHGSAVAEELKLLTAAGYTLPEAVKCASLNGAKLLGIDDLGVIAKDAWATFIAVKGGPSSLLDSIKSPGIICVKGDFIHTGTQSHKG
jgi:imidazolonepropionase-like amidohydrolase